MKQDFSVQRLLIHIMIIKLILYQCKADIYLEQPKSIIVKEMETAVFSCQLSNSSFSIYWAVNGSSAGFLVFINRGVTIVPINATASQLHIIGYERNNNTVVICAGRIFENYNLIAYVPSEEATLTIIDVEHKSVLLEATTSQKTTQFLKTSPFVLVKKTMITTHPTSKSYPSATSVPMELDSPCKVEDVEMLNITVALCAFLTLILVLITTAIVVLCIIICKQRGKAGNATLPIYDEVHYHNSKRARVVGSVNISDDSRAYVIHQDPLTEGEPTAGVRCVDNPSYASVTK